MRRRWLDRNRRVTDPEARGVPLGALGLTLAIQSLVSVVVYSVGVLVPIALAGSGLVATAIGVMTAVIYGLSAVAAAVGGSLVPRHGALRVSQVCLLLAGAGGMVCAIPYAWTALIGAVLIGSGYGPSTPASSVMLAERTPARIRNLVMSIRQTGVPVGGAVAGAVLPTLALALGWQAATVIMGVVCIAFAVAMQPLRPTYDSAASRDAAGPRLGLRDLVAVTFGHPRLAELALASIGYGGAQICLAMFMVAYLHEQAGYTIVAAGFVLSVAMVAGIIGRVLWGLLADWLGDARTMLGVLGGVMAVSTVLLGLVTPAWPYPLVVVLGAVFGASAIGWNGVFVAQIAHHAPPGKIAPATGSSLMFTYTGVVVIPLAFSGLVAASGYRLAYAMLATVIALAASLFFRRPR
jgi:MFS family permease